MHARWALHRNDLDVAFDDGGLASLLAHAVRVAPVHISRHHKLHRDSCDVLEIRVCWLSSPDRYKDVANGHDCRHGLVDDPGMVWV